MRISDWSSDVCSSDLASRLGGALKRGQRRMLGPAVIAGIRAASDECALQTFEDLGRTARDDWKVAPGAVDPKRRPEQSLGIGMPGRGKQGVRVRLLDDLADRKSTRLNSSH